MKVATIRFSERTYERIGKAAEAEGVSIAQYVRESALLRLLLIDSPPVDRVGVASLVEALRNDDGR